MTYRRIKSFRYARAVWNAERKNPRWWTIADAVWIQSYREFCRFWRECEIWGLFDGAELIACVYFEPESESAVNLHISVIGRIDGEKLLSFFNSLRRLKRFEGITRFTGWICTKNRHLRRLARELGFFETGLKLYFGECRGRLLEWIEVRN